MSGTDQALSSSSRFASSEDSRSRKTPIESMQESSSDQLLKSRKRLSGKPGELLKDGYVVEYNSICKRYPRSSCRKAKS
ncbi:hypothetical protein RchiOBHm_Chr1g0357991 [Rosa chinensis]|uniref:Uncharacterized protein n=1 Tax=Rosa chinensis TaxID=74649 RepID=A0A2P6SI10_ROSCH|nr:hypothetical protein RchiOBHm_Chr1g0357991 [Rosa chinensis]